MSTSAILTAQEPRDRAAAPAAPPRGRDFTLAAWRIAVAFLVLGAWEWAGYSLGDRSWASRPSLIAVRLASWAAGDLWLHLVTTLSAMGLGLVIGMPAGILCGLVLGRSRTWGAIMRPLVVAVYNVPLIALAPLLILWFGLDLTPKVVLVAIVTFFILFFATFTGAQSLDEDLIAMLRLMGASRVEEFRKVVLPASTAWIASAMRLALPYALIDAIMGELLASQRGIGFLMNNAISQVDMTGAYAALVVMMAIGVSMVALSRRIEKSALKWRALED
jgi:NitT/TauT family transport system permease protein